MVTAWIHIYSKSKLPTLFGIDVRRHGTPNEHRALAMYEWKIGMCAATETHANVSQTFTLYVRQLQILFRRENFTAHVLSLFRRKIDTDREML